VKFTLLFPGGTEKSVKAWRPSGDGMHAYAALEGLASAAGAAFAVGDKAKPPVVVPPGDYLIDEEIAVAALEAITKVFAAVNCGEDLPCWFLSGGKRSGRKPDFLLRLDNTVAEDDPAVAAGDSETVFELPMDSLSGTDRIAEEYT
jgi:hypothetical protein